MRSKLSSSFLHFKRCIDVLHAGCDAINRELEMSSVLVDNSHWEKKDILFGNETF